MHAPAGRRHGRLPCEGREERGAKQWLAGPAKRARIAKWEVSLYIGKVPYMIFANFEGIGTGTKQKSKGKAFAQSI